MSLRPFLFCDDFITGLSQLLQNSGQNVCRLISKLQMSVKFKHKIDRALMFFSFLQLAVGSRVYLKLRKITLCKAEKIHKMATIFTQTHFELSFCEFAQL